MARMIWAPAILNLTTTEEGDCLARLECWRSGLTEELTQDVIVIEGTSYKVSDVRAEHESITSGEVIDVVLRPASEP